MTSAQTSAINVVFGAMTFGKPGVEQVRNTDVKECGEILDTFQKHGHSEIDTSRYYGQGSSETMLADLHWKSRGLVMETKFYPTHGKNMGHPGDPPDGWRHIAEHLKINLQRSLEALKTDKIDMWYLHGPDRSTPYAETMKAVDDLYRQGLFKRFGISNFQAWEVAQICELCNANGWVKPSVYQGVYNALHRAIEPELLPCLRHYGIAYYNYNPLAGGFLTDRYHREDKDDEIEVGSRFDPKRWQGRMYKNKYWKAPYFDSLDLLRPVAKQHGLTEAECALRWMTHHSMLKRDKGDAIIIGASSVKQLEENLVNLEKGPLPQDVLDALDVGWATVKGVCGNYFH